MSVLAPLPSTMTPFLFQTRTLARLQRGRSVVQPRELFGNRNNNGRVIRRIHVSRDETTTTATSPSAAKGRLIRRTTVMRTEPRFRGKGVFDGRRNGAFEAEVDEVPRVIRRVYDTKGHDTSDIDWDAAENTEDDYGNIQRLGSNVMEEDFFGDRDETDPWSQDQTSRQELKTTITSSERTAFEAIFKNIRSKTVNTRRVDGMSDQRSDQAPRLKAKESLEALMGEAIAETPSQTREEMETVVNRYPPSLRALAARAVGLDYDEAHFEEIAKEEETIDNDQLEELRTPIREEVEAKMRAAKTDSELWDVMEKDVFPMIKKLGLDNSGKEQNEPPQSKPIINPDATRPGLTLPPEDLQAVPFKPVVHLGQEVPPLTFYGPLYPYYLLLGLRLLDRSFVRPSPLTLSILPKIKALGLVSHVLGASIQLYNELLLIYWHRYEDFRSILELLSEMEESGLAFDRETLSTVTDIVRLQKSIRRGDGGPLLAEIWSLPEFAPGKFQHWQKTIQKMLVDDGDPATP